MNLILPWHEILWEQILRRWQQDRLPHALLFSGPQGMGKNLFAQRLAQSLLCEHPLVEGQACQQCQSCYLFQAGTHPDLLQVQPAEVGKAISVAQIRELIQFCTLTAYYGGYQIVIIQPAEAMNRNAANSLLKLLEEPPTKRLILLISHQPMTLLATIRSRCQRLDFSHPDPNVTQTWLREQLSESSTHLNIPLLLNLSAQAPLAALTLVTQKGLAQRQILFDNLTDLFQGQQDPIKIVEGWKQWEPSQVLQWLSSWTMDMIRYATTDQTEYLVNQDRRQMVQNLAKKVDLPCLFELLDLQTEAYQLVIGNTNVKSQGLLESIAISWVNLGQQQRR